APDGRLPARRPSQRPTHPNRRQGVIAPTTRPTRWTRSLAALLLVLQGLAGSAVSLAHASERFTAPIHIEAQHASTCIALHDELRCTLCHYAGSQLQAQQPRTQLAAPPRTD